MKGKRTLALIVASGLTAALGITNVGNLAYAMEAGTYSDVTPNDPAYAYIEDVVDAGIMEGESDTEFGIDEEVTRGEVLFYIYRLMKSPQPAEGSRSSFEDIEGTDYETAVIWADSIGLFDGLDEDFFVDGLFHGDEGITREQLASLLMNLAQSQLNINVQENTLESMADISDNGDIKDAYIDAVKWAIGNQLLNTDQEQKFSPGNIVTKENIAEALSKLAAMVEDETIDLAIGSEAENSESASSGDNTDQGDTSGTTGNTGNGNAGNNSNQNTAPEKPAPEKPAHVHNWVTNYDTVEVAEQGHTEQQLVKEAWTETINHPAETHEEEQWVVDKEAWTETINHPAETHEEEQWVVDKEAWTETINHPAETHEEEQWVVDKEAVYETIHHPAETHEEEQWVVDKEAVYETIHHDAVYEDQWVVDKEAWDEEVWEQQIHIVCFVCGLDETEAGFTPEQVYQHDDQHILNGEGTGYGTKPVDVLVNIIHHPEEGHYEKVLVKEAWDEEVLVSPEEGHYETVTIIDKEAWDEEVLVSPEEGHYETVTITDKEAWTETIEHAEEGHYETVVITDKEAWTETIEHAEEGHYETVTIIDKEAWTETVEHPAEYKDVWVVDVPAYTTQVPNGYYCTGCGAFSGGGRG